MKIKEKLRKKILKLEIKYVYPIRFKQARENLKNKDFTIISDNCWGARVYQELGLPYQTPFVDLYIFSEDYIKLLRDLKTYLSKDLIFTDLSKFTGKTTYPIGLLGDVEIHFQHYLNEKDALNKWNKRVKRINYDNLFFKMNDSDGATEAMLEIFDRLPFDNKVIFSAKKLDDVKNLIHFKSLEPIGEIKNGKDMTLYHKYFDVVQWLNRENK